MSFFSLPFLFASLQFLFQFPLFGLHLFHLRLKFLRPTLPTIFAIFQETHTVLEILDCCLGLATFGFPLIPALLKKPSL